MIKLLKMGGVELAGRVLQLPLGTGEKANDKKRI